MSITVSFCIFIILAFWVNLQANLIQSREGSGGGVVGNVRGNSSANIRGNSSANIPKPEISGVCLARDAGRQIYVDVNFRNLIDLSNNRNYLYYVVVWGVGAGRTVVLAKGQLSAEAMRTGKASLSLAKRGSSNSYSLYPIYDFKVYLYELNGTKYQLVPSKVGSFRVNVNNRRGFSPCVSSSNDNLDTNPRQTRVERPSTKTRTRRSNPSTRRNQATRQSSSPKIDKIENISQDEGNFNFRISLVGLHSRHRYKLQIPSTTRQWKTRPLLDNQLGRANSNGELRFDIAIGKQGNIRREIYPNLSDDNFCYRFHLMSDDGNSRLPLDDFVVKDYKIKCYQSRETTTTSHRARGTVVEDSGKNAQVCLAVRNGKVIYEDRNLKMDITYLGSTNNLYNIREC